MARVGLSPGAEWGIEANGDRPTLAPRSTHPAPV